MDSSKIKKSISSITFDGTRTVITFAQNFTPTGQKEAITETVPFHSDMLRHGDFNRAMENFKAHWVLRSLPFVKFEDRLGKVIDKKYFDDHLYEDDPRFSEVEVKSVIITTKKDVTGFQINASIASVDDEFSKWKCPVISTLKLDGGYNYPLLEIAKEHLETLLLEAQEFLNYKSANGQLRMAV
jgi:hypothetical protein